MQTTSSIRFRILVPLTLALLILVGGFLLAMVGLRLREQENDLRNTISSIDSLYGYLIDNQAEMLQSQLMFLKDDPHLQDAFIAQDREGLLAYAAPIFERLKADYQITHFYFSGPDRVNFLRVHNPASFGDEITRYTTTEAERTGAWTYGVELGQSGLFTLRGVMPWEVRGERIGYLELGIEIDHLTHAASLTSGVEMAIIVQKPFLDRTQWENGLQTVGREGNWAQFADYVVVDETSSIPFTAEEISTFTSGDAEDTHLEKTVGAVDYRMGSLPFVDARGRDVGRIIIVQDVTTPNATLKQTAAFLVGFGLLVVLVLVIFFTVYVGYIERKQIEITQRLRQAGEDAERRNHAEREQRERLELANEEAARSASAEREQREYLQNLIGQIRTLIMTLNATATQIQAATTQQIASATEQDAAVTQTVATVEEVRATVQQTAESAQLVAESAQLTAKVSKQGEDAVTDSIGGMQSVRAKVENIAETILSLAERTQQISEIINTVNSIADQSKLLALNASIEAARAGEEGRGFAVVAAEVRQMAEQSRQATSRISDILTEIQKATNTAVMVTEEGSKGTDQGMVLVTHAGDAIRELTTTLESAMQSALQISASTRQQISGMNQLSIAMQQIKQASTQSAEGSRQTEQAARVMSQISRELETMIVRYQA